MSVEPGPEFRWGIITRRSVLNRDGTEGSTRRQEQAVHAHLKASRMGVVVAVYTDIASAYDESARRPEFENALLDLQAGRIDGIAVWKIDRLVRRASQYRKVLDILEKSGGRLFSQYEGIDTAAEGTAKVITNIVLSILVALAEMESESTGARTKLMHADRARQGLAHTNQVRPYGHNQSLTGVVPDEVKMIQEAAQRIIAGEAGFSITQDWTQRGIPTAQGKTQWRQDVLRNILMSPRMVAKRGYEGDLFDLVDVPPILDLDTWERVRSALAARSFKTGRKEARLLTNIAVCASCDEPLTGGNVHYTSKPTYVCRKRPNHQNACGKINVSGEHADARVGEAAAKFLADPTRIHALLCQHAAGPELAALHQRISELSDNLLVLGKALNPPPGKPRMSLEVYWQQVEAIEAERDQVQRKLSGTREVALLTGTLNQVWTPETWAAKPLDWKRVILRLITERIEVTPKGRGGPKGSRNYFDPERIRIKFVA